ncbi:MAG: DNA-processing protein DprA [Candidatus Limiplasma sp.]|nr:DNA-processing protein DprA [Clostridiales bacterium]MDY3815678.1 DNA-processing protein DprA [Candidatus Limiplasma sp.]
MILSAEQKCLLWLSSAEVTPGHVQRLLQTYPTVMDIWEAFGKTEGPAFPAGVRAVLSGLHSRQAIDDMAGKLERKNVHLLFQSDSRYPTQLKAIADPPYLLYYAGHLSCLEKPMVAIVGTRRASGYGRQMAAMLASGLCASGVCVVSGLARGIDAAAHKAALDAGGRTVGVLGSGINNPYPPEHTPMLRKIAGGIGLVLSEYPLDAEPMPFHFPHRNRIISGLSLGVVLVEGRIRSGGMHTVTAALAQGREVFAVPGQVGSYGSEGPHTLLREGARLVTSARDLLEDLGLVPLEAAVKKETAKLTPLQSRIVDSLRIESMGEEQLAALLSIGDEELMAELGTMEILGLIKREAGNQFSLPVSQSR